MSKEPSSASIAVMSIVRSRATIIKGLAARIQRNERATSPIHDAEMIERQVEQLEAEISNVLGGYKTAKENS